MKSWRTKQHARNVTLLAKTEQPPPRRTISLDELYQQLTRSLAREDMKLMQRKPIPLWVQVIVLKRKLAEVLGCEAVELDHRPPLYLRGDNGPAANDPNYIEAIPVGEHRRRTHGTRATSYGSDAHARAKIKRLMDQYTTKPPMSGKQVLKLLKVRPLPGGKASPLKKKLSGKVVKR